jgi:hypothetical protein
MSVCHCGRGGCRLRLLLLRERPVPLLPGTVIGGPNLGNGIIRDVGIAACIRENLLPRIEYQERRQRTVLINVTPVYTIPARDNNSVTRRMKVAWRNSPASPRPGLPVPESPCRVVRTYAGAGQPSRKGGIWVVGRGRAGYLNKHGPHDRRLSPVARHCKFDATRAVRTFRRVAETSQATARRLAGRLPAILGAQSSPAKHCEERITGIPVVRGKKLATMLTMEWREATDSGTTNNTNDTNDTNECPGIRVTRGFEFGNPRW